jgi:hypothetical protein
MRSVWLVALLLARTASAEPRRISVESPVEAFSPAHRGVAVPYLYLNRCSGGCRITADTFNDATASISSIPAPGLYQVTEFATTTGDTGVLADAEWAAILKCMQEVYSPYGVTVTDQPPPAGMYNMTVVAGKPQNVGLGADILGIALFANDCSPQGNVISFAFANHHPSEGRVNNICWTAAQESAHAYGLDHEFQFSDGNSSCSDPMTYRTDCGGQKFFRNKRASCGEMTARACKCSSSQNSHQQLVSIFGEGTPLTPPPTAAIVFPTDNMPVVNGSVVHVSAGSQRGVAKVELFLNGSRWLVLAGAKFGPAGQANPSNYTFYLPDHVPDGLIEIQARAYDDLGLRADTIPITVTKGAPCASDDACLDNQTCDAGYCKYPAPVGELGESCEYGQYCKSWSCLGTDGDTRCTQDCATDEPTSCPSGFSCLPTAETGTAGVCWSTDSGCCSVGRSPRSLWMHAALSLAVIGLLGRRRRK